MGKNFDNMKIYWEQDLDKASMLAVRLAAEFEADERKNKSKV